jgi:hypothetical protein
MNDIKNTLKITVDWSNLPDNIEHIKQLWSLRECIIAISFITEDSIIKIQNKTVQIGKSPRRNLLNDRAEALILGSTTLLSDIDVTIQSPHASLHIALIEDLWELTGWFNHSMWKIDLYGDFTMIGGYYMNTHYLNYKQKIQMLVLATASYFRHEHNDMFDISILKELINWCINKEKISIDIVDIINASKDMIKDLKMGTRDVYYKQLRKAEHLKTEIITYYSVNNKNKKLNELIGDCIIAEGLANLHREENYILVPTVIHVVKIEQGKENVVTNCKTLKITVARCSLSPFVFALSAIEQMGYMQEHISLEKGCNMVAAKYFGRLLRALQESVFKDKENPLKEHIANANDLAKEKKRRANTGIKNSSCKLNLFQDIKTLILDI